MAPVTRSPAPVVPAPAATPAIEPVPAISTLHGVAEPDDADQLTLFTA
jgi:hypothetical protein